MHYLFSLVDDDGHVTESRCSSIDSLGRSGLGFYKYTKYLHSLQQGAQLGEDILISPGLPGQASVFPTNKGGRHALKTR